MKKQTLAEKIDLLYESRTRRLLAQKQVDEMKKFEDSLYAEVLASVKETPDERVTGSVATAKVTRTVVPQLVDEEEFFAWARLKANRDCLKVAVALEPWRAFRAEGIVAPGVEAFTKEILSVSKVK